MGQKPVSRRTFAQRTALLSGSALLPAATSAPRSVVRSQNEEAPQTPAISEADLRFANIVRQYGPRLTSDQMDLLRKVLAENERMLAAVRSFPLDNGDAPASVLKISS